MKWLESWDDDLPSLNGEYWITEDGSTLYADGDIGDMNHEGYVIDYIQRHIADEAGIRIEDSFDWDEIRKEIAEKWYIEKYEAAEAKNDQNAMQELESAWENDYDVFFDEAMQVLKIDPEQIQIANGRGDPREYAMEKWGWKRVDDHNIETWTFKPHDIDVIVSGVSEIMPELEEEHIDRVEFYIYVYSTKQSYELTLGQMEQMIGQSKPQPQHIDPVLQQKNVSRDRYNSDIETPMRAAGNYQKDQDLSLMHPYYQNKKFPFADWTFRTYGKLL